MTVWVVVADGSRGRVFASEDLKTSWREITDFCNPEARLLEQDLTADSSGRVHDRMGQARHRMESAHSKKQLVKTEFVTELAEYLNLQFGAGNFQSLILAAPKRLLGELTDQLQDKCRRTVVRSYAKDLTRLPENELRQRISDRSYATD